MSKHKSEVLAVRIQLKVPQAPSFHRHHRQSLLRTLQIRTLPLVFSKMWKTIGETHREKQCFIQFSTRMAGWLLLIPLTCLHKLVSLIIHSIFSYYKYRCLKHMIHQIDSKNEWLLLPASLGLVFVLILGNAFSERFYFKANRNSIGSSKKRY